MPAFSTCTKCGFNAEGSVTACPRCNAPTRIVRESRARGWILVFCGLFLIGLMGWITLAIGPAMLHAGEDSGGMSFSGTPEQARMILLLFGVVIAFGATSLAYGLFQIVFRRESKAFILVTIAMTLVLVAVVYLSMQSLGGKPS
jgi:hypothetical protein